MSKYIWVNPVAEKMYGCEVHRIKEHLENKGYIFAGCDPQLEYVEKQYVEYSKDKSKIILDCRCPETINLLKNEGMLDGFEVPMIEPILIRTSRVLYDKYVKNSEDILIITCPCTQLRDHGRKLFEDNDNIIFYTWKEFIESQGMHSHGQIDESPIPLGFFRKSFEEVLELSGKEIILSEIKNIKGHKIRKYDIVEMLYCNEGCNNGDGL